MRTPTEHIRVEAKRMAIDLEKRRIEHTLTLAQEESMEQWLALTARRAETPGNYRGTEVVYRIVWRVRR